MGTKYTIHKKQVASNMFIHIQSSRERERYFGQFHMSI